MAVLLQIKNAFKSYGDQVLLEGAEATLTDDTKVGFVGRNGAGKSTLLRAILGDEELDRGEIVRHPKLRLGYLRQHDPFLPDETAIGFLLRDSDRTRSADSQSRNLLDTSRRRFPGAHRRSQQPDQRDRSDLRPRCADARERSR